MQCQQQLHQLFFLCLIALHDAHYAILWLYHITKVIWPYLHISVHKCGFQHQHLVALLQVHTVSGLCFLHMLHQLFREVYMHLLAPCHQLFSQEGGPLLGGYAHLSIRQKLLHQHHFRYAQYAVYAAIILHQARIVHGHILMRNRCVINGPLQRYCILLSVLLYDQLRVHCSFSKAYRLHPGR